MFQSILFRAICTGFLSGLYLVGQASGQTSDRNVVPMPDLPIAADMVEDPSTSIMSADPEALDLYGSCIESYRHDGRTYLLIGQSRGVDVRVLEEDGSWDAHQFIEPPETCGNDGTFGTRFALDGDRLFLRPTVLGDAARVHVFARDGERWAHAQDIGPAQNNGEKLGLKVTAASGWLAVHGRGDVSLLRRDDEGRYVHAATLTSPGVGDFDRQRFGKTVRIAGDHMAVSSFRAKGANECVDIYTMSDSGDWMHVQHLEPPHGLFGTWFGHHVRFGDGMMAISSPRWRDNRGRVDVYHRGAGGGWEPRQVLDIFPDGLSSFGTRFRMAAGHLLVQSSTPRVPGSAYLFVLEDDGYRRVAMYGIKGREGASASFGADALILPELDSVAITAPGRAVAGLNRAGVVGMYPMPAVCGDGDDAGPADEAGDAGTTSTQ